MIPYDCRTTYVPMTRTQHRRALLIHIPATWIPGKYKPNWYCINYAKRLRQHTSTNKGNRRFPSYTSISGILLVSIHLRMAITLLKAWIVRLMPDCLGHLMCDGHTSCHADSAPWNSRSGAPLRIIAHAAVREDCVFASARMHGSPCLMLLVLRNSTHGIGFC